MCGFVTLFDWHVFLVCCLVGWELALLVNCFDGYGCLLCLIVVVYVLLALVWVGF